MMECNKDNYSKISKKSKPGETFVTKPKVRIGNYDFEQNRSIVKPGKG